MKTTYMDYSATTYVKPEVLDAMMPFFTEKFGNPSSFYGISRETKMAIDNARAQVAKAINCDPNEVYFTGGGSEADNWAIKGIATAHMKKGNHIITTKIEHHAVLHTCQYLEKQGFEVTYLDVDEEGFVKIEDLKNAITDKTILVSVMFDNNEIGTIEPIKKIGKIAKENNKITILNPAPAKKIDEELLKSTDIIIPNETEAELLTGIKVNDLESAKLAVNGLLEKGVKFVIVTLGSKGAAVISKEDGQIVEAYKVKAIDTTAAGDSFIGGLSSKLDIENLSFENLLKAVKFANKVSSITVQRKGAQPSIAKLEEVIEIYGEV